MKKLNTTMDQIYAMIDAIDPDGDLCWGVRMESIEYTAGDELPVSRVWDDGYPVEDEYLDGTSSIGIRVNWTNTSLSDKAADLIRCYHGAHCYLIAGDDCHGGDDIGELVIIGAKVMAEIN